MTKIRWITSLVLLLALSGGLLMVLPPSVPWHATVSITVIHLMLSAVLVIAAGPLLYHHLRRNGRWRAGGSSSWWSLLLLLALIASGVMLALQGQRGRLALIHTIVAAAFLTVFLVHSGIAHLRRLVHSYLRLAVTIAFAALIVGAMMSARATNSVVVNEAKQFPPASFRVLGELPEYDEDVMGAKRCSACHKQIADEWKESMHARADTELLYARVVGEFRKEYGFEASNWCAGCHSPLRLARGELNEKVATVRQPNVDCIVCHSIRKTNDPIGNNNYDLAIAEPGGHQLGKTNALSDQLLLMQPAAHRSLWNGSFIRSPEFCGVCHRQVLPDFLSGGRGGLVLQGTFDEWAKSKYNSADKSVRRTCQDCHMPAAAGLASDLGDKRPSHLFLGGSIDVARINGAHNSYAEGKKFLAKAATITVTPSGRVETGIDLSVSVTNSGAGHNLPTGVTDLRQVWVELTVTNDAGDVIYKSGHLDAAGFLDPSAVSFGVVLGDGNGNPVHLHHIAKAREILADTTIPAGETREAKYRVPISGYQNLVAEAKLLYRAVPQGFINHYMTPDLRSEVVVMAKASATINLKH
jgi:hypothetical protein